MAYHEGPQAPVPQVHPNAQNPRNPPTGQNPQIPLQTKIHRILHLLKIPFMPNAPQATEVPCMPQLNWSHFKPEYSGKPDEEEMQKYTY